MLPTVSDLRRKNQAWKEVPRRPQLSAGPAGPSGAAQEEHLSLQRNASAAGLHLTTFAQLRVPVYMWSWNVRRRDVSILTRRLWPAGWGVAGKEGPAPPALAAAQVEAWLEGRLLPLAPAGSACDLKNSLECCRLCLPVRRKKRQACREVALHSPLSAGPAGTAGAIKEEHLLLPSGPAGKTLEDHLACFARRAQRPSRCHADRLPGLPLSAGLTTKRLSLFRCTASAVVSQAQAFTHSIFRSQASRREAKLCSIPTPSETVGQTLPSGWRRPEPLRWAEPAWSPLWG